MIEVANFASSAVAIGEDRGGNFGSIAGFGKPTTDEPDSISRAAWQAGLDEAMGLGTPRTVTLEAGWRFGI